ncbi:hypothetical protein RRG08_044248 [Elysia crispata]|uniref:Uncharacterized protein n=1 Tax=Elysia crispata TaxID=231223 RepID=A0AAE0XXQ8_9GAST|nr:hypothetical protein RRG08_044248 [Elysia crispata]
MHRMRPQSHNARQVLVDGMFEVRPTGETLSLGARRTPSAARSSLHQTARRLKILSVILNYSRPGALSVYLISDSQMLTVG